MDSDTPDPTTSGAYRFGRFRVDRASGRAYDGDEPCRIDQRVGPLLRLLIDHRGSVVSKDQIFATLWPKTVVSDAALSRLISVTRRFLGDTGREQQFIETVRGDGFRFVAAIEVESPHTAAASGTPAAAASETPAAAAPEDPMVVGQRRRRIRRAIFVAMAMMAGAAGTMWFTGRTDVPNGTATIAVMPFVNATGDPAQDYLGFGLAEELINALVGVPQFAVAARTSSFALHERGATAQEVGARLDVAWIVEGSYRRERGALRVTAQLIDTATGFHRLSETLAGDDDRIFALKQTIATRVTKAIGGDTIAAPLSAPKPSAYPLVLEGRHLIQRRTANALRRGQLLLLDAVRADPNYAPAHALLAHAYYLLQFFDASVSRAAATRLAVPAAREALDIDPDNPDALALMGIYATTEHEFVDAFGYLERGRSVHPHHRQLAQWHAEVLYVTGYLSEADARVNTLLDRDPLSAQLATVQNDIRVLRGDDVGYLAKPDERYEHGVQPRALWTAAFRRGDADAFCRHYRAHSAAVKRAPAVADILCDAAHGVRSFDSAANALGALPANVIAGYGELIRELALLDQTDLLLDAVDRAIHNRESLAAIWLPEAAAARRLPRFTTLISRTNLPALWNSRGAPDLCVRTDDNVWRCH